MSDAPAEDLEPLEAFARMQILLASRPAQMFQRVGGEVAFIVVGWSPSEWAVRVQRGAIVIVPETAKNPIVKIGVVPQTLSHLVRGTLDVERAFRKKRLAIEGDVAALEKFVGCFQMAAGGMLSLRTATTKPAK